MEDLREKMLPFLNQYKLPLGIGIVGLVLFGYGLISSITNSSEKDSDITFTSASENPVKDVKAAQDKEEIVVDVAGAVEKPGLYHLKEESRVGDAIDAAGGMSENADTEKIAKTLNLAAKLTDGSKVYIPAVGESNDLISNQSNLSDISNLNPSGPININGASESELDSLPGIGPVTAGKIINGRPYSSIDDLLSKKIVTKSVYEKIKEKVGVY